jgi:hemolysin activation/secretion protein
MILPMHLRSDEVVHHVFTVHGETRKSNPRNRAPRRWAAGLALCWLVGPHPYLSFAGEAGPTTSHSQRVEQPETFWVEAIRFTGHTVFGDEELTQMVEGYTKRMLDYLELEQARIDVTTKYIDAGYVNSGAVIDELPDASGVVTIRIVEGRLTDIRIEGNRWLREGFYRSRLRADSKRPLNVNRLRNELQLWRQVYPVERVNSELRPGRVPGEAALDITVQERFPYHLGVQYANDRPPSTGSDRVSALFRAESLTRNADQLAFDYVIVRGGRALQDARFPGVDDLAVSYVLPFTLWDTALGLSYARSSAVVIEEPFRQLDITAESEVFGVSLSQPFLRTPRRELILSLSGERKVNRSFLFGTPYSFSEGAIDGRSVVTVARLAAQWVERGESQMLATRLTLNKGLYAWDATRNASGPDGQFFSILGQTQYLRRLGKSPHQVICKIVGQYSPDPLLTLEQLAIGGANSVRGYPENLMLRDYGVYGTLEFHFPVWSNPDGPAYVRLVPFASVGAGWNNNRPTLSPTDISSAGLGVVVTPLRQIEVSVFWGYAFRDIDYTSHNPQNNGFHFKLTAWAF